MPYFKCTECHHEWEGTEEDNCCNWCGAEGAILEETTPLERCIADLLGEENENS